MTFDEEIERLWQKVFPLARLVHALSQTLVPPVMVKRGIDRGFRFDKPGLVHFCLLRAVRIVSALNASIALARNGFTQEVGVVLRTMIEYTTQIDFMLASLDENRNLSADASTFISGYFEDAYRGQDQVSRQVKLVQKKVHDTIGARLAKFAPLDVHHIGDIKPPAQLLSNVYKIFSNYVHGRYPESMDLFGGIPGHFHLNGMRGTPKDKENIEVLETLINSASLCFMGMVQDLDLRSIVASDPMLVEWFSNRNVD